MNMKLSLLATAFATAGVLAATAGHAETATANLPVTITIQKACNVTASAVDFGAQTLLTSAIQNTTGSLSVTCSNQTPYTIALGACGSGYTADRAMSSATAGNTDEVHYQLYTSSAYTTVWGDGTGSTATVGGTGTGSAVNVPVYAETLAQATPTPGSYSDIVAVTVTY